MLERGTEPGPVLLGHGLVHMWKFAVDQRDSVSGKGSGLVLGICRQ